MPSLRFPPALLGSFILLLFSSLIGLILAGRPDAAIWEHSDVQALRARIRIASEPDWRTVVLFSERETLLPAENLQNRIANIAAWASWARSALTVAEEVQANENRLIHFRMNLLFGLYAFDYTAPILERSANQLIWGRALPGATTLFAWQLTPASNGRTRVSLTAYLDAPAYGALRSFLEREGQAEIDRIVTHLLTAAR